MGSAKCAQQTCADAGVAAEIFSKSGHHRPQAQLGRLVWFHCRSHAVSSAPGLFGEEEREQVVTAGEVVVQRGARCPTRLVQRTQSIRMNGKMLGQAAHNLAQRDATGAVQG